MSKGGATQALVLEVSEFGVLAWGVQAFKVGGALRYLRLRPASDVPWRQIQVWDYDEWCSLEVDAVPPRLVARAKLQHDGSKEKCGILSKCADKKPVPLLKAAAHNAFGNLTVAEMSRLAQDKAVPYEGSRPTLEKDLVKLLVTWALPGWSSVGMDKIMKLRTFRAPRLIESVLTPENAEAVDGLLVEGDAAALKASVAARARKEKGHAQASPLPVLAMMLPGWGVMSFLEGRQHQATRISWTSSKTRTLSWQLQGASCHSSQAMASPSTTTRGGRSGTYVQRQGPGPKSWSQCWHPGQPGMSHADVLKRAIEWAWSVHVEGNPGADCPWDIDDV